MDTYGSGSKKGGQNLRLFLLPQTGFFMFILTASCSKLFFFDLVDLIIRIIAGVCS